MKPFPLRAVSRAWIAWLFLVSASIVQAAEPVRVLLPSLSTKDNVAVICMTMFLAERMSESGEAEVIKSERGVRTGQWLASGAFDLEPQDLWKRLKSVIAIDAILSIDSAVVPDPDGRPEANATKLTIRIAGPTGDKQVVKIIPSQFGATSPFPRVIAEAAVDVFKTMGLSDKAQKIASDPRIDLSGAFVVYYLTYNENAPWPGSPYLKSVGLFKNMEGQHWACDVAAMRVVAGTEGIAPNATLALARNGMIRALGTGHMREAEVLAAIPRTVKVVKDEDNRPFLDDIEGLLLEVAQPLIYGKNIVRKGEASAEAIKEIDDIESAISTPKSKDDTGLMAKPTVLSARTGKTDFTEAERIGALILLAKMRSLNAIPLFEKISKRDSVPIRKTVATSLADYTDSTGKDLLQSLATDTDEIVAFHAGRSLWLRGAAPKDFRQRAAATMQKGEPERSLACIALAQLTNKDDAALIDKLTDDANPAVRIAAKRARVAMPGADQQRLLIALSDPDSSVVMAAISAAASNPNDAVINRLMALANDPDPTLAWAARDALAPRRPADPRERAKFDLSTTAPYLREKLVRELAVRSEPWVKDELASACENPDPHTRMAALDALAKLDGARAKTALLRAITDAHRLVRLRAAASLAALAEPAHEPAITAALAKEKNRPTQLYLKDALAHAQNKPAPVHPEVEPVNSIMGGQNIAWLTSGGDPDSPFGAYYQMSDPVTEIGKKAHERGKAFFVRVSPIGNPGTAVVDSLTQDDYWLGLDRDMPQDEFGYIDGLVYGEESMSLGPAELWPRGWRVFCADVGIDPKRVAGDLNNLNRYEKDAWKVWAMRCCVEGFNRLYDYTKLQYGKLRPGIAVCTFLGEQALWDGPNEADFKWKFDVGGVYHYWGDSRKTSFSLVRRYKTIWPDRPVLWLSEGIGVYERTPIQFNYRDIPTSPMSERWRHCYVDAVTAWMAGADTGWFSIWVFLKWSWKGGGLTSVKGPILRPEQISPDSDRLAMCIDFAFAGVEEMLRTKEGIAALGDKRLAPQETENDRKVNTMLDAIQNDDAPDALFKKLEHDKTQMNVGFQFYRKYLEDLGRLFSSLPRNNIRSDALVIQPGLNVWEGALGSPGSDLLNYFDFLLDINKLSQMDLSRYRMITVKDPGPLTDATIAAVTKWLRESPGILYVHLNLTADNSEQFGKPECFDGKLKLDWPWEADVTIAPTIEKSNEGALTLIGADAKELKVPRGTAARTFHVAGESAKALLTSDKRAVLVVWRKPDFKGAVVFDGVTVTGADQVYRHELQRILNQIKTESGAGLKLDGPVRQIMISNDQWTAASTAGSGDPQTVIGNDLPSGERNPLVGPNRNAVFVGKDFKGKYAATFNGISVLCEQPIKRVEKIENGLRIECDGLIQASSASGVVILKPEQGEVPLAIPDKQLNQWLIRQKTEGVGSIPVGNDNAPSKLYFIRSPRVLNLTTK